MTTEGRSAPDADPEALAAAQRRVAVAMGACMALAWAPVVGGALSGVVQAKLVGSLLRGLGRRDDEEKVDVLLWFFNTKTLLVNAATYAPAIGPAVQVVLTWALGQLVIRAATDPDFDAMDDAWLHARWDEIEERIFSGEHVISTYEQFAGKRFPARLKPRVVEAVDFLSAFYRRAERVPGVAAGQHAVGGAVRRAVRGVTRTVRSVRERLARRRR